MDTNLKNSIRSFISNLDSKNYKSAKDDLTKIVEHKIQQKIAKATKEKLFTK